MVYAFWGEIIEESNDKGPYKLVKMRADGHEFVATILEPYGVQGSPIAKGQGLVIPVDGDMGKAVVIPMPPPAARVDQQKPGELTLINHKAGITIKLADDGTVTITATKIVLDGNVYLGGEAGAKEVHRKDDIDSDGDAAVTHASKVWAV